MDWEDFWVWLLFGWLDWSVWPWNWGGTSVGKKGTARGKKPQRSRDGVQGRVIYCGNCGTSGEHLGVGAVRKCYGRSVSEGPDYGFVSGRVKKV
jgi:hypothetical protein